jgi:hemerythrin-like domain-containing protein
MPTKTEPSTMDGKRSPNDQDAIRLLMADHAAVAALFKNYEEAQADEDNDTKVVLATQICDELTIHATIEEEIFYPAVREEFGDEQNDLKMLDEAEVEHARVKDLVAQIRIAIDVGLDPKADANVKVLSEYVEHHVREEEDQMFPEVETSDLDLDGLGTLLKGRKGELEAQLE